MVWTKDIMIFLQQWRDILSRRRTQCVW